MKAYLDRVLDGVDLTEAEAREVLRGLMQPDLSPAVAGAMLAALRGKGVTAAELRGLATAMRSLARRPEMPAGINAIDIVGTGGDGSHSFNISTGTALLVAACGVPVVKHGNRSVSSRSGSADVLEQLGLPLPLDERAAVECLRATGFTFLFAPYFHPAMKALAAVRQALGVRTVFNILGPLTNPAMPPYQMIGAYSAEVAGLMANALAGMPIHRAFVLYGAEGWDEPTPLGPFTLYDVQPDKVTISVRTPASYGLATCRPEALAGGDAAANAQALRAVLRGEDQGPHRDALLMGAALALELTGAVTSPLEGVERADRAITDGTADRLLEALAGFGAQVGR